MVDSGKCHRRERVVEEQRVEKDDLHWFNVANAVAMFLEIKLRRLQYPFV